MSVLSACMFGHVCLATCFWYLWRPEEGVRASGTKSYSWL